MERRKAFTELSGKYSLADMDLARLKAEFEITRLKLEFAIIKSETDGISLFESIEKYNAFHRYTERLTSKEKDSLIDQIKSIDSSRFSDLVVLLFLNSDRTRGICTHKMDSKCFDYHIWENEGAFIYFFNAIVPRDPFSEREIPHRRNELRDVAIDVRDFHPELKYVFSVSWIWNLRKFQLLMPDSFNDSLRVFKDWEYTQSYWGQFYRYDGTVNQERVQKFRKDWKFPLEPLIGECSIDDFIKFCKVRAR